MRKANVQLQADRRAEILAAAQRCFVRSGFHGASMQDICAEAGMSPGNVYRYFPSKEAIIAGLAERDRAEVFPGLAAAAHAPDLLEAMEGLARHHFAGRADDDVGLCTELMAESRRNPEIARIRQAFDSDVRMSLREMIRAAAARGDIAPRMDTERVVQMLMVIADGIWWRRALDSNFDAEALLPTLMDVIRHMLGRDGAEGESDER